MASYDGSITIKTNVDQTGIKQGMSGIEKSLKKVGTLVALAFGTKQLVKFGKEAISLASDMQEVQNVVDTAFGSMSDKMEEFADSAIEMYGISKLVAKKTGSTFMAMASGMGLALEEASDMSIALTGLSADMSSFYNVSQDIASTALKGIFSGETESLKQFGIVMTETNLQQFAYTQGINKKISAMTQAEKVQLRYNFIMQQTALAQGDFAKTSDSWANQTRILSERWKEFLSIIGTGLIQVLKPMLKLLNNIMQSAINATNAMSKLFGWNKEVEASSGSTGIYTEDIATNVEDTASSESDLVDGITAANKAAKKQLALFDDINVLNQDTADTSSGTTSGGSGIGDIGTSPLTSQTNEDLKEMDKSLSNIAKRAKEVADLFKQGFKLTTGNLSSDLKDIGTSLSGIKDSITDIFMDSGVQSSINNFINSIAFNAGKMVGSMVSIGTSVAKGLVGGIDKYLKKNKNIIKNWFVKVFDTGSEIATITGNMYEAVAYIFSAFGGENAKTAIAEFIEVFSNSFMFITELAVVFAKDILSLITQPFIDNKELFRSTLDLFFGVVGESLATINTILSDVFGSFLDVYYNNIQPMLQSFSQGLSTLTASFLEMIQNNILPLLQRLQQKFDEVYNKSIKPTIDKAIKIFGKLAKNIQKIWEETLVPFLDWCIKTFGPMFESVFGLIGEIVIETLGYLSESIGGILDALGGGLLDFLTGVFTADWKQAWNGIKNFFKGIVNAILSLVGTDLSSIFDTIKKLLSSIKNVWESVWGGLKTFVNDKIWEPIKRTTTSAMSAIKKGLETSLGEINKAWNNIWSTMKKTVTNIFDGIWSTIKKVINSIIGGIEGMANGVVKGINKVISAMNNLSFDIPDWIPGMGGKTFGFNIKTMSDVKIPRLATGAVIPPNKEFMAVLGDQKHGTNIETPLATMIDAFKTALSDMGGTSSNNQQVVLNLNGETFARLFIPSMMGEMNRQGYNVEVIGG